MDKPDWIKNNCQLAERFNNRIDKEYRQSSELQLIFNRYDVPMSLKSATDVSVAKAGLKCTDLCTCSEEEEICYNVGDDLVKQFDDSSDEDDE